MTQATNQSLMNSVHGFDFKGLLKFFFLLSLSFRGVSRIQFRFANASTVTKEFPIQTKLSGLIQAISQVKFVVNHPLLFVFLTVFQE